MKVSISKEELALILSKVIGGAVGGQGKTTLLALSMVRIDASGTDLTFHTSNLELSIRHTTTLAKVHEDGAVCLPFKRLADTVGAISSESVITLEDKNDGTFKTTLTWKVGKRNRSATLTGMDPKEFILWPKMSGFYVSLPIEKFAEVINRVIVSIATKSDRPVLNCLHLVSDGTKLRGEGADGFRAHRMSTDHVTTTNTEALIPLDTVKELRRLISLKEKTTSFYDSMEISVEANQVFFRLLPGTEVASQVVAGNFVRIDQVIPTTHTYKLVVKTKEWRDLLHLCNVYSREEANVVTISVKGGVVTCYATAPSGDDIIGELEAETDGFDLNTPYTIAANSSMLLEMLGSAETETIEVFLNDERSPIRMGEPNNDNWQSVLMPMHIRTATAPPIKNANSPTKEKTS